MKQSLSYYIILLVLKLKGVKNTFSQDPINYKKVRKDDIPTPKGKFFQKSRSFQVLDSTVTVNNEGSDKLILFIHGGAFISGPVQHHWDVVKELVHQTQQSIWMCNYPKAPENDIISISKNIDDIYQHALKSYSPDKITIIGDSVGGTLCTALVQRLVQHTIPTPAKAVLVSPVMDASLTNTAINNIELKDPMLSKKGVLSAKKMCAKKVDLKDQIISPLYGSFTNFPPTLLFLAERDIMYSDGKLAAQKMQKANTELKVIEGNNMPHIWPFLPVMEEAKTALQQIITFIKK